MKRLYSILPLALLMNCSEATPKEKQKTFTVYLGALGAVECKELFFTGAGTKSLLKCNKNVKEIINATNIIIYE